MKHPVILIVIGVITLILVVFVIELLVAKYDGSPVAAPTIPRETQKLGNGSPLNYVIMGDSTAIGQGADYTDSYAAASARHLAQSFSVRVTNVGISGARTEDVVSQQLNKATALKPDIVLLAVGANDARRFTKSSSTHDSLTQIVNTLRKGNPQIKIVVTGSPDMSTPPRFLWPLNQVFKHQTNRINDIFSDIIVKEKLTHAPIAKETGSVFAQDPTLFAKDKFHPNARGYAVWTPVINRALDQALSR